MRYDLEDVYYTITNNLKTGNEKYKLPAILKKYHKNINPVRAIYFEIQEIDINFNIDIQQEKVSTREDIYNKTRKETR